MNNKPLKLTANGDTIDGILFGCWRYYIGRGSIAAACMPAEIAQLLKGNPQIFSPERREFAGLDIRDRVNDILRFNGNINVCGFNTGADAFMMLCHKLAEINDTTPLKESEYDEAGVFNPDDYNWTIDVEAGTVDYEPMDKPGVGSVWESLRNLTPWAKLAGWLAPTHDIELVDEYSQELGSGPMPGFEVPIWGKYRAGEHMHFKMALVSCSLYERQPSLNSYIAPDAIKHVEKR